jgi:hypothetical protein
VTCDRSFSPGTPVPFTNKTDRHDITEIVLKVALDTIKPKPNQYIFFVLSINSLPLLSAEDVHVLFPVDTLFDSLAWMK